MRAVNKEYAAVCALLQRSGLKDISQLNQHITSRNFHTSPNQYSQTPKNQGPIRPPERPDNNNNNNNDDKDKISSLLAKAFLWMLTAYMVIAIISLMFPSTNQPEVSNTANSILKPLIP